MHKTLRMVCLAAALSGSISAAELQGTVVDWACAKDMAQNGREKTLRDNRACSLMKDYNRPSYGLITQDKKFYKLDDPGNQHILELLKNTPDKDNLKVVVNGDISGDTIKVNYISML